MGCPIRLTLRTQCLNFCSTLILVCGMPLLCRANEDQLQVYADLDIMNNSSRIIGALILGVVLLLTVPVVWHLYRGRPLRVRAMDRVSQRNSRGFYRVPVDYKEQDLSLENRIHVLPFDRDSKESHSIHESNNRSSKKRTSTLRSKSQKSSQLQQKQRRRA